MKTALIIIGGELEFKYLSNCNRDAVSVSHETDVLIDLTVSLYVVGQGGQHVQPERSHMWG